VRDASRVTRDETDAFGLEIDVNTRKSRTGALIIAAAVSLVAACSSSGSGSGNESAAGGGNSTNAGSCKSGKDVLIADFDDFSGAANVYAQDTYNGAQLAANQINQRGGIKALCGAKITLKKYDTQSSPDQGAVVMAKVVADHPVAIIGGSQGATIVNAANINHRVGTPWLVSAASSDQIVNLGYKEIFVPQNDAATTLSLLDMLKAETSQLGLSDTASVEYVYSQGTFGVSSNTQWKQATANTFHTVGTVSYSATTTDFSAIAARAADANADIIVAACYPPDCISLARLWKTTVKPKSKIIVTTGAVAATLTSQLNGLADTFIVPGSLATGQPGLPASYQMFYDGYHKAFGGVPGFTTPVSYTSVLFVDKALEKIGTTDASKLADALHQTSLTQADGNVYAFPTTLAWQANGTRVESTNQWGQVQNGQQAIIYAGATKTAVQPFK
jgi:branched-chain amino acid transport system substrate-binding protein